jgi:hypothetical protein
MQSRWDEGGRRVVRASGSHTFVPYLGSLDQVQRWIDAGFDLDAAAGRTDELVARFRAAADFDTADKLLQDHFAAEAEIALSQGVPEDDPDLHRIRRSTRAFEFAPA